MLKNCRLIALVFVFAASGFGAFAQTDETNNFKDVLLDGKPAKLNLITGEITFSNGEIATSRTARKVKDSLLDTRTEIKTNLIKDMVVSSETTQTTNTIESDSVVTLVDNSNVEDSTEVVDTDISEMNVSPTEVINNAITTDSSSNTSLVSNQTVKDTANIAETNPYDFHMVKKGETLYQLSKRYKTSLGQLQIANNLETTLIQEGETLRVRNFEALDAESDVVWTVSKGDTLYNIAKRNNTTVNDLIDLNELSGSLIKIGQKLQVNQNSTLTKK